MGWQEDEQGRQILGVKEPKRFKTPEKRVSSTDWPFRSTWVLRDGKWRQVEDRVMWIDLEDRTAIIRPYAEKAFFRFESIHKGRTAAPTVRKKKTRFSRLRLSHRDAYRVKRHVLDFEWPLWENDTTTGTSTGDDTDDDPVTGASTGISSVPSDCIDSGDLIPLVGEKKNISTKPSCKRARGGIHCFTQRDFKSQLRTDPYGRALRTFEWIKRCLTLRKVENLDKFDSMVVAINLRRNYLDHILDDDDVWVVIVDTHPGRFVESSDGRIRVHEEASCLGVSSVTCRLIVEKEFPLVSSCVLR